MIDDYLIEEDEFDGEERPFLDEEPICVQCDRLTARDECRECGAQLCPMCFSSQGGFCSECPTEAYGEIYRRRIEAEIAASERDND